ncbi:RTA1 like protein-domain-containing protein [Aspergillus novoparasiticus]|uniref:RTA1 like protein-domain-containing protein n=1 Tax=Aspergillus novoparasiticus TaxID=986946 RepID=A0A5N6EJX5_9EURO|nr:RTA1 like protein-domain-containing protein [Aspergillus novoparasiticus]
MGLTPKCDLTNENAQYPYCASPPAAIIFSVLFGVTFAGHLALAILYRKRFCWVIIVGSGWECLGLIMRAYSTLDQTKSSTLAAAQLLVLLAPLWINAFVYMIFGRMVYYFTPNKKIKGIKAESMAKIFIWLDITAFIIQGTGGILDSDGFGEKLNRTGMNIYTAGIAIQEFFILCFLALLIVFHKRMLSGYRNLERGNAWKLMVYGMYATLLCLTTRIVYRLIEFANPNQAGKTVLSTKEAPFYILECVPIFIGMMLWNVLHPGRMMPGPDSEFPKLSRSEKKQMKQEAKEAKKQERRVGFSKKYTAVNDSEYTLTRPSDEEHEAGYGGGRWPLNEVESGRGGGYGGREYGYVR